MKQPLGVIVTAALVGLAPFTIGATERSTTNKAAPAKTRPAAAKPVTAKPAPATPAPSADHSGPGGDTVVHGFFQGWANGMNRGARAIGLDKDPLEGRLPGGKGIQRRTNEGPFDNDPTR
ncbi:hypothetical protein [Hydrogenophaga laconesensis]|uniref:Uncharacterized protein n=1 Tax=Hydrogenophaga laconesensis TaxID=1805971 RepID=A0ABU1VBX8_9BURK|nr:hypothetical protein [Hydrogenophaga laconesensis]MDR7094723.1 hypothetical protein [Hydrogenophaga laconesensis]